MKAMRETRPVPVLLKPKLPSPIEWVNKRKIRAKDSVNNVWWFSKSEWPQADVSQVLTE